MSFDISKYVDVSNERRSPVWNHTFLNKEKGEALCKLCLDKKSHQNCVCKLDPEDYEEKALVDDKSVAGTKSRAFAVKSR